MKVKFIKQTFVGKPVVPGDIIDVDQVTGKRLISRKIAELVIGIDGEVPQVEEVSDETTFADFSYEKLTNKELFDLCKQKEIELDKTMINGKTQEEKRAYLISKLTEGE